MYNIGVQEYMRNHLKLLDKHLIDNLALLGEVYVIGGALRSYRNSISLRDIDIIIQINDEIANIEFELLLSKYNRSINKFGGSRINLGYVTIDIWRIEDTWAYKYRKIQCDPSEYAVNLQNTVFLNIDSIIYHWQSGTWYDSIYNEAIRRNTIDIILEDNPAIIQNITKALVISKLNSMQLSNKLKQIIVICAQMESLEGLADKIMKQQIKRYKTNIISRGDIVDIINTFKIEINS